MSDIRGYHAHIYYADDDQRARAARLREAIEARFSVVFGRWRDAPVGPHPRPMFQIAFAPDQFATLVPWLMLNRDGLTIFLHPETGRPRDDHAVHAVWFGEMLPLDVSGLPEVD